MVLPLSADGAPAPLLRCKRGGSRGSSNLDVSLEQRCLRRQADLTRQRASSLQPNNWVSLQKFQHQPNHGQMLQGDSPSGTEKLQVSLDDPQLKLAHLFIFPQQAASGLLHIRLSHAPTRQQHASPSTRLGGNAFKMKRSGPLCLRIPQPRFGGNFTMRRFCLPLSSFGFRHLEHGVGANK